MILAGDIAIWTAFVMSAAFCLIYMIVAPWNRSEEGVHLMTFTAYIAVLMGYLGTTTVTRAANPSQPEFRFVLYVALAGFMAWRLSLLVRVQVLAVLKRRKARADGLERRPQRDVR